MLSVHFTKNSFGGTPDDAPPKHTQFESLAPAITPKHDYRTTLDQERRVALTVRRLSVNCDVLGSEQEYSIRDTLDLAVKPLRKA